MAAHSLLDITMYSEIKGGEGKYLYEPDPESPLAKCFGFNPWLKKLKAVKGINPGEALYNPDPNSPIGRRVAIPQAASYERVVYVPFVPDMIARVDADHSGSTIYFTLPPGH